MATGSQIPQSVARYFSTLGKRGKGEAKRRSAEHYARLAQMKKDAAKRIATVEKTGN